MPSIPQNNLKEQLERHNNAVQSKLSLAKPKPGSFTFKKKSASSTSSANTGGTSKVTDSSGLANRNVNIPHVSAVTKPPLTFSTKTDRPTPKFNFFSANPKSKPQAITLPPNPFAVSRSISDQTTSKLFTAPVKQDEKPSVHKNSLLDSSLGIHTDDWDDFDDFETPVKAKTVSPCPETSPRALHPPSAEQGITPVKRKTEFPCNARPVNLSHEIHAESGEDRGNEDDRSPVCKTIYTAQHSAVGSHGGSPEIPLSVEDLDCKLEMPSAVQDNTHPPLEETDPEDSPLKVMKRHQKKQAVLSDSEEEAEVEAGPLDKLTDDDAICIQDTQVDCVDPDVVHIDDKLESKMDTDFIPPSPPPKDESPSVRPRESVTSLEAVTEVQSKDVKGPGAKSDDALFSVMETICRLVDSIPEHELIGLSYGTELLLQRAQRKRIIATGGTPRTSISDKGITPQHLASLRRTSAFDTTPIFKSSLSPSCVEIKDSSTKGFQFRKSISSVLPMDDDSHVFEDSSCLISDVQTPGSSWKPSLSSTKPTLNEEKKDKSSSSFNFWSSNDQDDDCILRPTSRLSDVQIVDPEPEALFYSPKKAASGPEVTADCRGGSGRQSSSHTTTWPDADGDDFYIDDFDIDEFEDADIPEYFDEPPSASTSKRTSSSFVCTIREEGPVKTMPARSAVSTPSPTPAPKPSKPPSPEPTFHNPAHDRFRGFSFPHSAEMMKTFHKRDRKSVV